MTICPDNFLCLNRNTMLILIIFLVVVVIFYINKNNSRFAELNNNLNKNKDILENKISTLINIEAPEIIDTKLIPPLRKPSLDIPKKGIPINIRTRGEPTQYQQVGVLTDGSGSNPKLLPLYGRETYPNSNIWNYYTSSDGFQSVKLSVLKNSKNCQEHYGCKEITDGENVSIRGYNSSFKANVYKLETNRYIPYII